MEEFSNEVLYNMLLDISGKVQTLLKGDSVESPDGLQGGALSSSHLNELFAALAKAQAEMPFAGKIRTNPHWSELYEDLPSLIHASRPALTKNGLAVSQILLQNEDGQKLLHTILSHSSGQWLKSVIHLNPPKQDDQTFRSHLDIQKRNAYAAITGVASVHDDDDGELSSSAMRPKDFGIKVDILAKKKLMGADTITKKEYDQIDREFGEYPEIVSRILDHYRIQSLKDLPASAFNHVIKTGRLEKNTLDGRYKG